ncbi:hypothetical protein MVEN_00487700 [Mycena venus]|uniref:Uncharacterized protein n=1 Tax=Mycena venus TaxID=2733690 RepID=A0A8H6YWQ6_9AGAR|nr:hypothetical protein MVEN_00487700 [Mycena venus]
MRRTNRLLLHPLSAKQYTLSISRNWWMTSAAMSSSLSQNPCHLSMSLTIMRPRTRNMRNGASRKGRRRGIITDLQRKMFPKSSPWEIVFIENGGGSDMSAKLPVLPDGLLSHQNLYDAICNIVKRPSSDGSLDLVGIQSLQVLTGAGPLGSLAEVQKEVLVGASKQKQVKHERNTTKPLPESPDPIMHERASNYLGMTYDNALGTFGCTNVLEEQHIDLGSVDKHRDFERTFRIFRPGTLTMIVSGAITPATGPFALPVPYPESLNATSSIARVE